MIEINGIKQRDEKRQIAFFTIDGQEFTVGNVPAELTKPEDVQAHLDARADEFKLLILRKQYPGSDYLRFEEVAITELEAMEKWISKGHKNKIPGGYEVIAKQELEYKHPKWVRLLALIDAANITPELKGLLKEIVK